VTGATGLLGTQLVQLLVSAGADVVGLVRDWVPCSELVAGAVVDRIRVVRGDVRHQATVERAIGEYEVATVLHLAAQTTVGVANRNPVSTLDTNIRGTWTVLEACRRSPTVQQVVIASSDKAYGEPDELPYKETARLEGRHPYDVSKSCVDLLAQMYAGTYGVPACVTRCGNFYGGGDLNWNRLVPGTIRSVLRGERPIIRSDGQYVRDYLYVEDGARAYMRLAEKMADGSAILGDAFNFSDERPLTVLAMVQAILGTMGSPLEPEVRNEASNEIRKQYLDASKSRSVLGWAPTFTLEAGLRATVAWYTSHFKAQEAGRTVGGHVRS